VKSHGTGLDERVAFFGHETCSRKVVSKDEGIFLPLVKLDVGTVGVAVVGLTCVEEVQVLECIQGSAVGLVGASAKVVDGSLVQFQITVSQRLRSLVFLEGLVVAPVESVFFEEDHEGFGRETGRAEEVCAVVSLDALRDVDVLDVVSVKLVDARFACKKKKI